MSTMSLKERREAAVSAMGIDLSHSRNAKDELRRYEKVRAIIDSLPEILGQAADKGLREIELVMIDPETQPWKAFLPFVKPSSIEQYSSPSYKLLWDAVVAQGATPLLKSNPRYDPLIPGKWLEDDECGKISLFARLP